MRFPYLALLAVTTLNLTCQADDNCEADCRKTYVECKASMTSSSGEKVCGRDYNECKTQCATGENSK